MIVCCFYNGNRKRYNYNVATLYTLIYRMFFIIQCIFEQSCCTQDYGILHILFSTCPSELNFPTLNDFLITLKLDLCVQLPICGIYSNRMECDKSEMRINIAF